MAIEYYKGDDTYVIYGEESVYGTLVNPSASSTIGRVRSAAFNISNNLIMSQGIGEGRNVTQTLYGGFDVNGTMEWEVNDFTFMQYAVGNLQGAGTVGDPYELKELNRVGYVDGTDIPTLTLEFGNNGTTTDQVVQIDGVVLDSLTLSASQGSVLTASCSWVGRSVTRSTTLETYSAPTSRTFVFQQGTFELGSSSGAEESLEIRSFSVTINNNVGAEKAVGSRFNTLPVPGNRRYTFTITLRKKLDSDTSSVVDATEVFGFLLDNAKTDNTPATGGNPTGLFMNLDLSEGGSAGDRIAKVELQNVFFDGWGETASVGNSVEITVTGHAHSGLADASDLVPIRWYTQ